MITCYFGLPGCGKSTMMAKIAHKHLKAKARSEAFGRRYKYDHIYCNDYCRGTEKFKPNDLGKYDFSRSLILIDEITLAWDSRNYKSFPEDVKEFFILHRHYKCDVIYFTQYYKNVDKRIRDVTAMTYKVNRGIFTSVAYEVPEGIVIPMETGEITQGHHMPGFFKRFIFAQRCWRRRYFKYFNSFSCEEKPPYVSEKW